MNVASPETIVFQWGRIQSSGDWVLPLVFLAVGVWIVWRIYRSDTRELAPLWQWVLPGLRTGVLVGLWVLWLQPQWRTEQEVQQNSQVAIFLDTSLSMTLAADDSPHAEQTRTEAMTRWLSQTPLLEDLRQRHDLILVGLDVEARRMGILEKKKTDEKTPPSISWEELLTPQGTQTRIADSLREWLQSHSQMPLTAILLLSDGTQNAGGEMAPAVEVARTLSVPIHTVGFGSTKPVENLRIYEVEAPVRVQPQDPFTLTAWIQSHGGEISESPQVEKVELWQRQGEGAEELVQTQEGVLGKDGKPVPVTFEVVPPGLGKYTYVLKIPVGEREWLAEDNVREIDVEVVDKKTRILILAGGPTREYQFLLTTLFRDKTMETDVWLQSARPGISQEATKILETFPESREAMLAYDVVIAIDPDWKQLTPPQIEWLDEWLSRHGGGLLLVAGPVYMGESVGGWLEDPNFQTIRAFYPVEFPKRFSTARQSTYAAEQPWPLDFTREGMEANFLRLGNSLAESTAIWDEFPGVFGYFPTQKRKAGATSLAYFSNPQTGEGEKRPVLLATQFYGSGRVLYLGTGEFWRLRSFDPNYFTQLYTQTLRYLSQGRMSQQSSRGRWLLAKERYFPGEVVNIRAMLLDAQLQPLDLPELTADLFLPDGKVRGLKLSAEPQEKGYFKGTFTSLTEGTVRIEITLPESEETISQKVEIVLSDRERENPQRNQTFLNQLAHETGGLAFLDVSDPQISHLPDTIRDRTRTTTLSASADPAIQRDFLLKMMGLLVGLLGTEWILRRLLRLA
ncbi:MAG: hypothetical protein Q4E67_06630 [Planctomycetia bacterium]|nr:hypothetical protein [Planctomycetia bacterium]